MATVNQLHFALTLIAVLGCGLMGGVFFAFSPFRDEGPLWASPA